MTLIGGPTVAFTYAGLTVLTDPTFDQPGVMGGLTKTVGPAVEPEQLGSVDLALISHDHHPDNLDASGLEVARAAGLALTTVTGARRTPGLQGIEVCETITVQGSTDVHITAVEAQHGPALVAPLTGPVIGFVLRAQGWPTVYFSGDNSSTKVAARVAVDHPDVTVAILCAGAARVAARGTSPLTLDAARVVKVAALWPQATLVPVHWDSWAHFSEPREAALPLLKAAGLGERLVVLEPGLSADVLAG